MNKELEERINFVSAQIPIAENHLKTLTASFPKNSDKPYQMEFNFRANSDSGHISLPHVSTSTEFNNKIRAELEICRDRIIRLYEKHLEALKQEYDEL